MHPRGLSPLEKELLGHYVDPVDLANARLQENHVPWYLLPGFVGITRGNHIYLRPGTYVAGTAAGLALLGHELVHVAQFRRGMTPLRYVLSCWRGYRRSRYEQEAFAVEKKILAEWFTIANRTAAMHDTKIATRALQ